MRMSCKLSFSKTRKKALLVLGGVEKMGRVEEKRQERQEEKKKDREAHSNIFSPKTQLRKISKTEVGVCVILPLEL